MFGKDLAIFHVIIEEESRVADRDFSGREY